jgi:hypothetical protein
MAVYCVIAVLLMALLGMIYSKDTQADLPELMALAGIVLAIAAACFVQKLVYFTVGYKLYYENDIGDFGFSLLDGVTTLVGREPDKTRMSFDNEEILVPGQTKGFSVSMYIGLNYGSENTNGYKWNKNNDLIKIPLFVRGQTFKTALQDYGPTVVDKSPLIWLVLDKTMPSNDVAVPFIPKFLIEFNHAQATYAQAGDDNSCKVVDDITASCQFFKESATFDAFEDAQALRIDPNGPPAANRLKHVAFVFEEMFVGDAKLKKQYVTKISVYVGSKLKQTHTFRGSVRVSDNRVSLLPRTLYMDATDPLKASPAPYDTGFLRESRIGYVKYYAYPLSSDQIGKFAARHVPLKITEDAKNAASGNTDTDLAPGRST